VTMIIPRLRWCTLSLGLLTAPGTAYAQVTREAPGRIAGVVRDSASGAPIMRALVCGKLVTISTPNPWGQCTRTGEDGRFRIDSVPTGTVTVRVICAMETSSSGHEVANRTVAVSAGAEIHVANEVAAVWCDQRPMEHLRGRITGLYYNADFEMRWFFPDGRATQLAEVIIPSTLWPNGFLAQPRSSYGLGCVRVTIAGNMRGPLESHGAMDSYGVVVDSVVAARHVPEEECFKIVERFLPGIREFTKQYRRGGA
jgi:hypothetical protein